MLRNSFFVAPAICGQGYNAGHCWAIMFLKWKIHVKLSQVPEVDHEFEMVLVGIQVHKFFLYDYSC